MKERVVLEPKTVGEIFGIISPVLQPTHRTQFIGLARSLGACWQQVQQLNEEVGLVIKPAKEDLQYAENLCADIHQRRTLTEQFIYNPRFRFTRGRLAATLGRIKVALGLAQEHPWLAPLTEERIEAREFMEEIKSRYEIAHVRTELEFKPRINQAQADVEKAGNQLVIFSESCAINSLGVSINYARILPQRSDELARKYGQIFGLDPERVINLSEFISIVKPYIEARTNRDRAYSALVNTRPLIDIPSKDLPESIKHRLQVWTAYQFLLILAQEGIIYKPQLPDLLRRL